MDALDSIRIVLVEPEHPGNIGAVARVMANMGLRHLVLVAPADFPSPVAVARASGSDVLSDVRVVHTLDEAIADCTLVAAATARARTISWPHKTPEAAMRGLLSNGQPAALVFGRESSGLTNAELDRCHFYTRIPVAETFSSMNLGSAASVLLYELRRQARLREFAASEDPAEQQDGPDGSPEAGLTSNETERCTAADMHRFLQHLETVIDKSDSAGASANRMRVLARVFNRAPMLAPELRLLRGVLSAIEAKLDLVPESGAPKS